MRICKSIFCILLFTVLISCGKEMPGGQESDSAPELTVLIGTDGFGDLSYNDNMLEGILGFCQKHPDVKLDLQQPTSIQDAERRLNAWLSQDSGVERALILASNSYEDILRGKSAPKSGRVLIMETDDSFPGHSSYIIRRYGASWLCGSLSGGFSPFIIKAMDGNDMIDESESGFSAGFRHVTGNDAVSRTLADGPEGFSMRDSTYRFVYNTIMHSQYSSKPIIFPLLGRSISGVFDFRRYVGFVLVAGMDVDCSAFAPESVPFSLMINNNLVLDSYLEDWLQGKEWPAHEAYGLESSFVEVRLNPTFSSNDLDMQALYKQYYPLAVEKEKAYETH